VDSPNVEIVCSAWLMAEQCLQHTREILTKSEEVPCVDTTSTVKPKMDATLLARYAHQFRPRIFNSQRAEKSQLIEESRQMGLVPDFSEVASRETQCAVCEAHVLSHQSVLEEHVRTHLSLPSYRSVVTTVPALTDDCTRPIPGAQLTDAVRSITPRISSRVT
jgi:hypothetical protein